MNRAGSRAALVLGASTAVLLALGIALAAVSSAPTGGAASSRAETLAFTLAFTPPVLAFAVVGGLISHRRRGHPVGWLLAVIGALFALVVACSNGSRWALTSGRVPTDVGEWVSVGANAWVVALGLLGTQLPLRLPDGHLPSRRWRWFSRLTLVLVAAALVGMATQPGQVEGVPGTSNPLGSTRASPLASTFLLVIAAFPVAIASLVLRYRRSGARDKAQVRWVAFGGAIFLGIYLVALPFTGGDSDTSTMVIVAVQCAFATLPIAIGYAMLRHDLYDIDVVINRALVYGSVTVLLATSYVGGVLLLQLALRPLTSSSDLAVAGSTLAVAALFRPARERVRALVDRRFYRGRYDAAQTLAEFTAQLRDQLDAEALADDICRVVQQTVQPTHVTLWVPTPVREP
ncbi:MAG TPA: hypothetical protein VER39_08910 [Nocardioidaceae bacterium]|nr:hypothetical protein [Nocardioidaceae bacterium]